ncbi:MAG TPA: carbohydrate-binding family 9-like protein [Chitinophaga sp.]
MMKYLLLLWAAMWHVNDATVLKVKATADFQVTGDGSHANWNRTEWITLPQRSGNTPLATKVKMLYSQSGVYVLFQCSDQRITATMKADFMDLWKEDVVEVFLWPDENSGTYFEYEISPLNYELPILISNNKGALCRWMPFHYEADRKTQHAVSKQSSGWTAECYIPYTLLRPLNNIQPQRGTRWRANFYRVDYDSGEAEWSWQLTGPSFHEYEKFGTLLFE